MGAGVELPNPLNVGIVSAGLFSTLGCCWGALNDVEVGVVPKPKRPVAGVVVVGVREAKPKAVVAAGADEGVEEAALKAGAVPNAPRGFCVAELGVVEFGFTYYLD